ncbi:MAG: ABC transporter permease [Acidobacteriota bacterium]
MPERWSAFCRRLVPASFRERVFDPAVADLHHERTRVSELPHRWSRTVRRTTCDVRLLVLALECRRLALAPKWSEPLTPSREGRVTMWLRDLRLTLRTLARQPGFTAAAVATLALGTGANLTIFSFVNAFLLAPIPARDPATLVRVYGTADGIDRDTISYPDYVDGRDRARGLDLAAHAVTSTRVGPADAVEIRTAEVVTGNYFRVLGLTPTAGRLLDERDDVSEGVRPVVVLSHGYWRSQFAGSPTTIGQKLIVNGVPFEIVGVAPPGYRGTFSSHAVDFWAPLMMHQTVRPTGLSISRRGWGWLSMIGRLQPGVDIAGVRHDLDLAAVEIRQRFSDHASSKFGFAVTPASAVNEAERGVITPVLATAFGFTVLLMIVTCANLAGVMQARVAARRREMAVRQALGAGRGRLASEWLTECFCLAIIGGVAGLLLARLIGAGLSRIPLPLQILGDFSFDTALDWRVIAYAAALSLVSGLVFGLAPAWRASRLHAFPLLKDDGGTVAGGRRGTKVRRAAVFVQITISVVLLTGAGLLATALVRQQRLTPGFRTDELGLASFNLHRETPEMRRALTDQLLERVRSHPAVESADISATVPLSFDHNRMGIAVPGYVRPDGKRSSSIDFNTVGPAFFQTLGITFVAGESWSSPDPAPKVLVVNETFARRFWPEKPAVGQSVEILGRGMLQVAGVVKDHAYYEIGESPRPFMYVPTALGPPGSFTLHVRTRQDPSAVMKELRTAIAAVDPRLAPYDVMTFDELRAVPLFPARMVMWAAVAFGLIALLLTSVGLYGVVSTSVAQRAHEIGIRMALGARPRDILRGVLREAAVLVLLGAAGGVVVAYFGARVLEAVMAGAGTFSVTVSLIIAVALGLLALVASWAPARRAARVDPVSALKP